MGIDTTSRRYSDNLRAHRRFLQGRGVNFRKTIIDGGAVGRLPVPGLHDDDKVISVFNMTDLNDATGYLDDNGDKAQLVTPGPNVMTFTARKPGIEGNNIYIQAAAAPGNDLPLTVDVLPYLTAKTRVLINLATGPTGVALTDGSNDLELVRAAIFANVDAERIIDVDEVESPYHDRDLAAFGPSQLTGGANFKQGPSFAQLITDSDAAPYGNDFVLYVAAQAGAKGNDITVAYTAGSSLDVVVTGRNIVVTYVVGVTTVADVIAAVNASAAARAYVLALPYPDKSLGSELIATMPATNLSGGLDPAIKLTVTSAGKKLEVSWVTHDQLDEDTRA